MHPIVSQVMSHILEKSAEDLVKKDKNTNTANNVTQAAKTTVSSCPRPTPRHARYKEKELKIIQESKIAAIIATL